MKPDTQPFPAQKLVTELTETELIDEFSRLKLERLAFEAIAKPKKDREESCQKLILENQCASLPANQSKTLSGNAYVLIVGEKRLEKIVLLAKLWKRLGVKVFLTICEVAMKALQKAIPDEEERKKYYTEEQTGWRSMKPVPKPQ